MSYVVHLFEHPGPATLDEATALHSRLSATAAPPNPKFAQLAKALIQRFPVEVGGTVGGIPLWLESVPDGGTGGSAVYSLGVYDGGLTHLLPVLVGLALPMGLCVYDDQAGRCYVPGGFALTARGRHPLRQRATPVAAAPAAGAAPTPLTMAWVNKRLREALGPALAQAGFTPFDVFHSLHFSRATEAGLQHITFTLTTYHDSVKLNPGARLEPELPHALYRPVRMDTLNCEAHDHSALAAHAMTMSEADLGARQRFCTLTLDTGPEVEALLPALLAFVQANYLSLLQACRDVPGIARACLAPQDLPAFPVMDRVALALLHWTGQADVQAVLQAEEARHLVRRQLSRSVVREACVQRLAAMPGWRRQWHPTAVPPRRLPRPEDRLPPQAAIEQLWPRLCRLAEARGFEVKEEEPRRFVLRRAGPEVGQTLRFDLSEQKVATIRLEALAFECPAVSAYLRQFLAPWAPSNGVARAWPFRVALKPGALDHLDIDARDLSFSVERADRFADHVQAAEASLVQLLDLLDRTRTLAALAVLMAHERHLPDWSHGNSRYGFEETGCLLLLAAVYAPDRLDVCTEAARARFKFRGMGFRYDEEAADRLERVITEAQRLAAAGGPAPFQPVA